MRFRESIQLDRMIDERHKSLDKPQTSLQLERRARALSVLIDARNKLDEISNEEEPVDVKEHITFTGTAADGRKIKRRRPRELRKTNCITG